MAIGVWGLVLLNIGEPCYRVRFDISALPLYIIPPLFAPPSTFCPEHTPLHAVLDDERVRAACCDSLLRKHDETRAARRYHPVAARIPLIQPHIG